MDKGPPLPNSGLSRFPPSPEVLEEYKFIGESLAHIIDRRQRTNDVYATINALFLSGIGLLLVSSRFDSWRAAIEVGAVTTIILPLNWAWRAAIVFYRRVITTHAHCLRELEERFQFAVNLATKLDYTHIGAARAIAYYFLILYPVITAVVAALTYLVMHHLL